jgi:hypothetical protein
MLGIAYEPFQEPEERAGEETAGPEVFQTEFVATVMGTRLGNCVWVGSLGGHGRKAEGDLEDFGSNILGEELIELSYRSFLDMAI